MLLASTTAPIPIPGLRNILVHISQHYIYLPATRSSYFSFVASLTGTFLISPTSITVSVLTSSSQWDVGQLKSLAISKLCWAIFESKVQNLIAVPSKNEYNGYAWIAKTLLSFDQPLKILKPEIKFSKSVAVCKEISAKLWNLLHPWQRNDHFSG